MVVERGQSKRRHSSATDEAKDDGHVSPTKLERQPGSKRRRQDSHISSTTDASEMPANISRSEHGFRVVRGSRYRAYDFGEFSTLQDAMQFDQAIDRQLRDGMDLKYIHERNRIAAICAASSMSDKPGMGSSEEDKSDREDPAVRGNHSQKEKRKDHHHRKRGES